MDKDRQIEIIKATFPFLDQEELKDIFSLATYRRYQQKETIIASGTNAQMVFFILSGMVRGYFLNQRGEEKNIFLRPERTFTAAPNSIFNKQINKYTFEAISETHILAFDFQQFETLASNNPNLFKVYLAGLKENILTLVGRVESLIDKRPEERYEDLLKRSPQFFQTAYHKHIANYLGITAVSLSRIMKRSQQEGN